MTVSPFKFLDSYTRQDKEIFFGRDREIGEMYQKVFEGKILLVYGISGTGKTSLINCGLANKFEDSDWLPVTVRRGRSMVGSLVSELRKNAFTPPSSRQGGTLPPGGDTPAHIVKTLQSIYLDHFKPIYLIFDQFEELFIFGDREEREQFIQVIKAIVDSDVQCRLIFSIREEYLASVTEFELTLKDFLANRIRVEKMTRQHAVDVIEGPCKVHGIKVEEGFSEALLHKLNPDSNEIELTYLQVFLDKICRLSTMNDVSRRGTNDSTAGANDTARSGVNDSPPAGGSNDSKLLAPPANSFTLPLLEQIGDVSGLLGSFLEEQISALDDPDIGLAILKSFVSLKGTRKQISEGEIQDAAKTFGQDLHHEVLKAYLQQFVNLRILKEKDETGRYELRHDSLADKIYEKITLVEKEILEVRQFIENAYNSSLQRKMLLTQEDLKYIAVYEDNLFLSRELQDFVDASKEDYFAKRRAFRRIIRISTVGFILMIAAVGYYYFLKSQGRKTKDLIITAALQLESSPELSLKNAFMAYEAEWIGYFPTKAILDAFYNLYEQHSETQKEIFNFSACSVNIASARFSHDGTLIYGWLENNELKVWNDKGAEVMTTTPDTLSVIHILLSDDNKYVAVLLKNEKVRVYSLEGEQLFEVNTTPNYINDKYLFDFSQRDEYLLAIVIGDTVSLYDRKGDLFQKLGNHTGSVNALDISSDERFIATASSDSKVNIWYYNMDINQFSIYDSITGHKYAVRSCMFNNRNDYILTSSDDSTTAIWKLTGEILKANYTIKNQMPWIFEDDYDNYLSGKECDAVFSKDQESIKVSAYHKKDSSPPEYRYHIRHAESSIFSIPFVNQYVWNFLWLDDYTPVMEYQYLVPSENDSYIATVVKGAETTNLVAPDMLQVMRFNGIQPDFSPDGKYLLCVQGNTILKYVIDVEEIRRLVYEVKIFGELEIDYHEWITY